MRKVSWTAVISVCQKWKRCNSFHILQWENCCGQLEFHSIFSTQTSVAWREREIVAATGRQRSENLQAIKFSVVTKTFIQLRLPVWVCVCGCDCVCISECWLDMCASDLECSTRNTVLLSEVSCVQTFSNYLLRAINLKLDQTTKITHSQRHRTVHNVQLTDYASNMLNTTYKCKKFSGLYSKIHTHKRV